MWTNPLSRRTSIAPALILLAASARGQTPPAASPSVESELVQMRMENGAIREQINRLEEQQKILLRLIDQLEHRLDGTPAPTAYAPTPPLPAPTPKPIEEAPEIVKAAAQQKAPERTTAAEGPYPDIGLPPPPPAPAPEPAAQTPRPASVPPQQTAKDRNIASEDPYADSIVLVKTREGAKIPILLRLWDVTQLRYTNTELGNDNYTDHLGAVRPVIRRNDFSLNRNLIQFVGYIFDKRLQFNLIGWASNSSAAFVQGGYISWRFNKAIGIYAGYWGAPGTRSLTGTFPYFVQLDRSMADQFFRPGFTQGTWIDGEFWKGLHYELFAGNGLNTLTVPTTKIDRHLVYSGSFWWEPLGIYGISGRARGMYDDYQGHEKPVIRVGANYTHSKENRFANLEDVASNPENVGLFNSDGVNTFATGAFAPGVTVTDATYRMFATDAGVKWRGFAFNMEYFFRWLNRFRADGPIPVTETFDHGFETEISQFVLRKRLELYGRTSMIFGQFRNSYEYAPGVKWYLIPNNHRVWLVAEGLRIVNSPVASVITPYQSGYTGWAPLLQWMFNF